MNTYSIIVARNLNLFKMKKNFTLSILFAIAFCLSGFSQTIWDGPKITFTKENNADFTLEENQDRITENVWITRGNAQGIFNIKTEMAYADFLSPADTEWAFGTTSDIASLTFLNWEEAVDMPPASVDQDMVLHLITDDIYIDVKFLSWTQGNGNGGSGGGGFSYERSTEPVSNANEIALEKIQFSPNPVSDYLYINNLMNGEEIIIYDMLGKQVLQTQISDNSPVAVGDLAQGIYSIRIEGYTVAKFVKK